MVAVLLGWCRWAKHSGEGMQTLPILFPPAPPLKSADQNKVASLGLWVLPGPLVVRVFRAPMMSHGYNLKMVGKTETCVDVQSQMKRCKL